MQVVPVEITIALSFIGYSSFLFPNIAHAINEPKTMLPRKSTIGSDLNRLVTIKHANPNSIVPILAMLLRMKVSTIFLY